MRGDAAPDVKEIDHALGRLLAHVLGIVTPAHELLILEQPHVVPLPRHPADRDRRAAVAAGDAAALGGGERGAVD